MKERREEGWVEHPRPQCSVRLFSKAGRSPRAKVGCWKSLESPGNGLALVPCHAQSLVGSNLGEACLGPRLSHGL